MGPTTGIGAVGPGGGIPGWGGTPGGGRRGTALSVVGDAGGGAAQDPICLCQDLEAAVAGGVRGVTVGVDQWEAAVAGGVCGVTVGVDLLAALQERRADLLGGGVGGDPQNLVVVLGGPGAEAPQRHGDDAPGATASLGTN